MASPFVIEEHEFEGAYIREYPKALAVSDEDVVRLHAKSYTPRAVASGEVTGDLTIIAFHANAFHKEVYEPFFEVLYELLKNKQGLILNSIWIADQAAQGSSALLNDGILGNDPSWFDHSRDVIAMVNTYRRRMKRPIVGIGHSMGGTQALATAHFHPRLFEALIMIDPSISQEYAPSVRGMLQAALRRPESFESRELAEKAARESLMTRGWEPRVLQRYIETAFHDSPTVVTPNNSIKPKTTKYAEATTISRINTDHVGVSGASSDLQRTLYPNIDPDAPLTGPIYNVHTRMAWNWLPTLRPSALFINGQGSRVCRASEVEKRTNVTGVAPGGSGGAVVGRVTSITISGGHLLPMTNVYGTAEAIAIWLRPEITRHNTITKQVAETWNSDNVADRQRLEPTVEKVLRDWDGKPWAKPNSAGKERSRL